MQSPSSLVPRPGPAEGVDAQTLERLRANVLRLTRALGVQPSRSTDGITTASVQMLSKMISRYDVTKAPIQSLLRLLFCVSLAVVQQVSVQATQRTLSESAADPAAYAAKYESLKAQNVKELDRLLMIGAKVLAGAPLPLHTRLARAHEARPLFDAQTRT